MEAQIQQLVQEEVSMFRRPADLLQHKIYRRVFSKDGYEVWYVDNFLDLGHKACVRKALQALEKKGYMYRVKAYPVFWKRMQ